MTDSLPQIFPLEIDIGVPVTNSQYNPWDASSVGIFSQGLPFQNHCWAVLLLKEQRSKHKIASNKKKGILRCHRASTGADSVEMGKRWTCREAAINAGNHIRLGIFTLIKLSQHLFM